jgi:hypothetical protein
LSAAKSDLKGEMTSVMAIWWPYWLIGILLVSLLIADFTNRRLPGFAAAFSLLAIWWYWVPGYSSPISSAPSTAQHYDNGIWIDRGQPMPPHTDTIGYGENHFSADCQGQLGDQLLQFERIAVVVPVVDHRFSFCQSMPEKLRRLYRKSVAMKRKENDSCGTRTFDYFRETTAQLNCVDTELNKFWQWKLFFNCAQATQEYQLRILGRLSDPLTGGEKLVSFAGINFTNGRCLDPSHRRLIEDLLDVVGLGPGRQTYSLPK